MQQSTENTPTSLNSVTLVGRTGKDPELKYFESGTVKAAFSVAVNRGTKDNRITDWFNVDVFGRTAEVVGEYLKKGREVAVTGRMSVRKYNDEAGNERDALSVTATDVQFLGNKRDQEGGGGYNGGGGNTYAGSAPAGDNAPRAPF